MFFRRNYRLYSLARHCDQVIANPRLGVELLAQSDQYLIEIRALQGTGDTATINRLTRKIAINRFLCNQIVFDDNTPAVTEAEVILGFTPPRNQ